MSKIKRNVINLEKALGLDSAEHNWQLVREHDNLTHTSEFIQYIEWKEDGSARELHDAPSIGYSLIMSPFNIYFTWQTTAITEIIYVMSDGGLKFKTKNSVYTLTRINK